LNVTLQKSVLGLFHSAVSERRARQRRRLQAAAKSLSGGDGDGADGAVATGEALEPSAVVELGVLLVDQALFVDLHEVDTNNGVGGGGGRSQLPAPGDVSASVPDVESVDLSFGLTDALANVESSLVGEGDTTKLQNC
jgi:hypothetical protein